MRMWRALFIALALFVALFGALLFAVHPLASEIPNYARTQDLAWVTLFSLLASWAFLFLIAPLLAAYGLSQNAAWHFYFITVAILPFVIYPAFIF